MRRSAFCLKEVTSVTFSLHSLLFIYDLTCSWFQSQLFSVLAAVWTGSKFSLNWQSKLFIWFTALEEEFDSFEFLGFTRFVINWTLPLNVSMPVWKNWNFHQSAPYSAALFFPFLGKCLNYPVIGKLEKTYFQCLCFDSVVPIRISSKRVY